MLIYASSNSTAPQALTSWQPILDGGERARALELARDIALAVRDYRVATEPSLLGGAGIAVFCAYAEATGVIDDVDVAGMLSACVERAAETCLPIGLWNGCAGLRWTIAHLADGEVADAITTRLDAAVHRALVSAPSEMSFDLYSGLAGVLLAYAEEGSAMGLRITGAVLERLGEIDWSLVQRLSGCAHGIAGVAAALACWLVAQTQRQTQTQTQTRQSADSNCMPWLVDNEARYVRESQQAICADDDCHVAISVACARARQLLRTLARLLVPTVPTVPTLPAAHAHDIGASWCSGGPGVALALFSASRALADDELAQHALHTMRAALHNATTAASPADATLCHGASGLAHLCNRLYHATGDGELGELAIPWLRRTMDAHVAGTGVAGFRRLRRKPTLSWEADPSVLVGAAGIGLVLLAAATPIAPLWDHALAADVCRLAD
jgi:lantibiotic modifying enzyme